MLHSIHSLSSPLRLRSWAGRWFFLFLLLAGRATCALAGNRPETPSLPVGTAPSLAEALAPDGTLRAGVSGSFDARRFVMRTALNGRPVFHPAGTTGTGDERWQNGFTLPNGTDGTVVAVVQSGPNIYIGGQFTQAGNVLANNVAKWNGTAWSSLGTGIATYTHGYTVEALAVAGNGDVYAGGGFDTAGGVAANKVAKWNGTAWSALGSGLDGHAIGLAVAGNGDVYAVGEFTHAGNVVANNIARWNGTAWSSLGTGTANGVNSGAAALAVAANGDLYVGGYFTQAGGVAANCIAKWNGTTWSALGTGVSGGNVLTWVKAVAVSGSGEVYVGGSFKRAGGVAANYVAKWDGTAWSALGAGVSAQFANTGVSALALASNGDLYVGGYFTQAGWLTADGVAKWTGTDWSSLDGGVRRDENTMGNVTALAVGSSGEVYVGGRFAQAASSLANNIARWSGSAWSSLGSGVGNGLNGSVMAVAVAPNGEVYVGGDFTAAGPQLANRVAKWNGRTWSSLGTGIANGVDKYVRTIAVVGNEVYVGGGFTVAGGISAAYVAKWDGTRWSSLGTGVNYPVYALAAAGNGGVYVGGDFTFAGGQPATNIARWTGTTWRTLGASTGFNGRVSSLVVAPNGDVYAGGGFTQAGGVAANRIAKWNGATWASMGTANSNYGYVDAIALAPNGNVYASGSAPPIQGIAKWNGSTWTSVPLGPGVQSPGSMALTSTGTLYAGGTWGLAKWNGSRWSLPGTGVKGDGTSVWSLAAGPDSTLYVGGDFMTVGDGSKIMARFGVFDAPASGALGTAAAIARQAGFSLYPNPARGTLLLALPSASQARTVQVFDATGRQVSQQQLPAGATSTTLSIAGLQAGLYIVRLGAFAQQVIVE